MNSLVEELWDEWSAYPVEPSPLVDGECAGLLSGLFSDRGDPLRLGTARLWAVRRLLRLWRKSTWAAQWNVADALSVPYDMKGRVQLQLPDRFRNELESYGTALSDTVPLAAPHWAWLRGLWGGCGGLYIPKSGYYLVLRVASPAVAAILKGILQRTRMAWQKRLLHGTHELILRDQQKIVTFLSKIGLTGISLRMEDKAIMRSMRDRANRIRNCDTANIKRTLRVAEEQMALALKIRDAGMLDQLPPPMRQMVEARLNHPEVSLSELGEGLSPPITKSTVKYRWQRLIEYAENMAMKRDEPTKNEPQGGNGNAVENLRAQGHRE